MGVIIAIVTFSIVAVILVFGIKHGNEDAVIKKTNDKFSVSLEPREYNAMRDGGCVGLTARKGYSYFGIVGTKYYIPSNVYGRFDGYAVAETDNQYDQNAVAIYTKNGTKLGHLAKSENKKISNYIKSQGGKVHAYGFIALDGGYQYGNVCIESNFEEVSKRNKPYTPDEAQLLPL